MAHASKPGLKQAVFQPDRDHMTSRFSGTIQAINPSHAFVLFGQGNKDCAYFSSDNIDKSLLQPGKSLNDLFNVGDKVRFNAQPSPKPTSYIKWWATNVKKVPCAELAQASDSEEEAFLSDDDIAELLLDPEEFSGRRKLSGIRCAFFPNSKNMGLVFSFEHNVMVRVVLGVAYCNGKKISSFGELLKGCTRQDAVVVFVDAVEAEQNIWVATLMWTGKRPEHPVVEQSENTFHYALALAMSEMPAGACDLKARDLSSSNTSPNFCSVPGSDHSVAVYPHSKGILKAVNDNSAVCEVQETEGCRNVEFLAFYRNNVPHVGDLKNVLRENDVVHIDYMVGTVGGREEVCCRLVWQGGRPSDVHQMSPAEFGRLLKARAAQHNIPAAPAAVPQSRGRGRKGPSSVPSSNLATIQKPGTSSLLSGPSCSKWPSADLLGKRLADKQDVTGPSPSSGPATGNATMYSNATTARHPPEPNVYVFSGRKGTVMKVCASAAMVEAREGLFIREVMVTADCFYRDGRTVLTDLNRVLHKGDNVNIDYMVGRMGCKDSVHCNMAWQGRKPQGVPCLSPDEFKEKISAHGSGNTFINDLQSTAQKLGNSCKDAPRGPAKYSLSQADTCLQMEVHQPPPRTSDAGSRNPRQMSTGETNTKEDGVRKVVDHVNALVRKQIRTTLHEEVPKVIEDLLDTQQAMIKRHSAQILQGEGDSDPFAEPSVRQYSLVPGPAGCSTWQPSSASQQPSVTAGPFPRASQTSWGEAMGQFELPQPRFTSNRPSVLPTLQPVTVTSPWQPSNALHQPIVAADLSPQASQMSWGVAVRQVGQPLSSFNNSPATILPEVLPATVWPAGSARPSGEVQRYASMLPIYENDLRHFRNLGISLDTPSAVERGQLDVGAWRLGSTSAQQEGRPGASSSDYKPQGTF